MKRALITGVTGQDGSYLAEFLLSKGYEVHGVLYEGAHTDTILAIIDKLQRINGDVLDTAFVQNLVSKKYDEIYNLASISTVQSPWEDPVGTITSCGMVPIVFLEAIRSTSPATKFFQASSAEMFGDPTQSPQNEKTALNPRSPYAYGKVLAHHAIEGYRNNFNTYAVSGILFNHESPRRGEHFVTRKITSTLARIANGSSEVLQLGNLDAKRDWSFAGDIVEAMWLSLQQEKSNSYVFASGEVHTVREFVEAAANALGLAITWDGSGVDEKGIADGRVVVEINPEFFRPLETLVRCGDISKAKKDLDWKPKTSFKELVEIMSKEDLIKLDKNT